MTEADVHHVLNGVITKCIVEGKAMDVTVEIPWHEMKDYKLGKLKYEVKGSKLLININTQWAEVKEELHEST